MMMVQFWSVKELKRPNVARKAHVLCRRHHEARTCKTQANNHAHKIGNITSSFRQKLASRRPSAPHRHR